MKFVSLLWGKNVFCVRCALVCVCLDTSEESLTDITALLFLVGVNCANLIVLGDTGSNVFFLF